MSERNYSQLTGRLRAVRDSFAEGILTAEEAMRHIERVFSVFSEFDQQHALVDALERSLDLFEQLLRFDFAHRFVLASSVLRLRELIDEAKRAVNGRGGDEEA